jgi:hypothetical protein
MRVREVFIFCPLILGTLAIGVYQTFLSSIHMSVHNLIELLYF